MLQRTQDSNVKKNLEIKIVKLEYQFQKELKTYYNA